ncbi:MAG: TrkH family potassium uptake protein [Lachnospiraceae bacterium]|nr:TrkH family potassium uptake protein [Lachnospiraceae bacterium]
MNFSTIRYIIGWILRFESFFMLLPALVGFLYQEKAGFAYLFVAMACFLLSYLLTAKKPASKELYLKDGFIVVALGWIVMSLFGALPFTLSGDIPSYVDALFEAVSGFTTTGASILADVESISHASLIWRSFSHWIGGMGVFVFIMAVLPLFGGSTMNMMKAESTGPSVDKLVPRVKNTAKILYGIYIFMTILQTVILVLLDMPLFEAMCTSFGTTGTGGFGFKNDSFASFSPAIQLTVAVFMILSGVNYSMYFLILRRKIKQAFSLEEVWWYFGIIGVATLLIFMKIKDLYPTLEEGLRHSIFQVGAIITSTGYATTDYNLWPPFASMCLIVLMFIGACAGSTGGGIKVSRIIILAKSIKKEISSIAHPQEVSKIRLNGHPVSHEVIRSTNVFLSIYLLLLIGTTLLISIDGQNFTTNFTAVVATLNNTGPGLDMVGPTGNFGFFSNLSKLVLIFNMLAGRLELFPILLLLFPVSYRKH